MNSKLILFDIDKTLISKMNLAQDPWKLAFEKVFDIQNSTGIKKVDTHGKTFKGLAVEGLRQHDVPDIDIKNKLDTFLYELENIYHPILEEGEVFIYDGIKELLTTLTERGFCLGLITGNSRGVAFAKLRKAGIDTFFAVGGFGEDSATRDDLVDFAVSRSKEKFAVNFQKPDIFVVGDTPLDISSAKTQGLTAVGVATGAYTKEQLAEAGSDYVLDNLQDISGLISIFIK